MDIKKIIQEEINDFEWAAEVPSGFDVSKLLPHIHSGKYEYVGVYVHTKEQAEDVQRKLFELGYIWVSGKSLLYTENVPMAYFVDTSDNLLVYDDNYDNLTYEELSMDDEYYGNTLLFDYEE